MLPFSVPLKQGKLFEILTVVLIRRLMQTQKFTRVYLKFWCYLNLVVLSNDVKKRN